MPSGSHHHVALAPEDPAQGRQPASARAGRADLGMIADRIADHRHRMIVEIGDEQLPDLTFAARIPAPPSTTSTISDSAMTMKQAADRAFEREIAELLRGIAIANAHPELPFGPRADGVGQHLADRPHPREAAEDDVLLLQPIEHRREVARIDHQAGRPERAELLDLGGEIEAVVDHRHRAGLEQGVHRPAPVGRALLLLRDDSDRSEPPAEVGLVPVVVADAERKPEQVANLGPAHAHGLPGRS